MRWKAKLSTDPVQLLFEVIAMLCNQFSFPLALGNEMMQALSVCLAGAELRIQK